MQDNGANVGDAAYEKLLEGLEVRGGSGGAQAAQVHHPHPLNSDHASTVTHEFAVQRTADISTFFGQYIYYMATSARVHCVQAAAAPAGALVMAQLLSWRTAMLTELGGRNDALAQRKRVRPPGRLHLSAAMLPSNALAPHDSLCCLCCRGCERSPQPQQWLGGHVRRNPLLPAHSATAAQRRHLLHRSPLLPCS